eukprot:2652934-Rhodomonas_salina.2
MPADSPALLNSSSFTAVSARMWRRARISHNAADAKRSVGESSRSLQACACRNTHYGVASATLPTSRRFFPSCLTPSMFSPFMCPSPLPSCCVDLSCR